MHPAHDLVGDRIAASVARGETIGRLAMLPPRLFPVHVAIDEALHEGRACHGIARRSMELTN